MNKGYVYLVGAGPGDPKLITIKGSECIAKAEVLVYDRLASRRLLTLARPDCELIYVGKSPDRHTLKQDEINQLLVDKGLEGKIVTRLKGGDPFVFGRGGEEAEALLEAGIPFEVVPGITSAISVPAYAGIPVTHRDLTSSFAVITGHEDPTKNETSIQWNHIAQSHGTLVFLMGMENLPLIAQKLMENGRKPTTPVGIIQWGTRPEQRTLVGSLNNIAEKVKEEGFTNPSIIIVGEVVSLREKLQWFEKKPLFGQRIIVTRARHQASELSQAIEALGGEAWEFPVIEIAPPTDKTSLLKAIEDLKSFQWLIFTSVNGVETFFAELLEQKRDVRDLAGIELVAIGPATKAALEKRGLRVAYVPEEYRAEKIVEGLNGRVKAGDKVLLARAEEARNILPDSLKGMGVEVWDVPVYKTILGSANQDELQKMLQNKEIDSVTFTSSSTVKNFMKLLDGKMDLLQNVLLYSIGPITSATARELGLTMHREASEYTINGLVDALLEGKKHD
ncbi:uroporphyrinogen-III C-methyltransferase, uroporphyrinogen-III synthase [Desulfosporosinus acidiphilus SJ4]|uniref:uroporphyrinogen-III C-methyltransferase n=1 Tax=Desulfosporosinus acidiphilus (strain DSM 22704 / JCM 16185 / SJ4) TaxID=646529 RepID=I4D535_DESAJ|nr:uroporphyrinogen-III C-methyltransferase [Desulfosporosinus acidiphilus]AFM40909.1 uroporphyrinogen-III C-methyltransferase, uroporphyrinogen-III synthase [Desulfosporosinus acidiphilus SJ4]